MGKKVAPEIMRVGIRGFRQAVWFNEQQMSKFIIEDYKIRELIDKILSNGAYTKVVIERTSNITLTIFTHRPGLIIGKKGEEIEKLKNAIIKLIFENRLNYLTIEQENNKVFRDALLDKIQKSLLINIQEVHHPELNAKLICESIVHQLENRKEYKSTIKRSIALAMENGAVGIRIKVCGRPGGVSIARTEKYKNGSIPLQTFKSDINRYQKQAKTVFGVCGVSVMICMR